MANSLVLLKVEGTEFPMFIARLFLHHAALTRVSSALLFGDLRKAYYSVLVELVTGPPLTPEERLVVLENTSMDDLRKVSLAVDMSLGHCLVDESPIPQYLKAVVREWQRLAWYTVEGSQTVFVHNIGVKPGDPSADVLFALRSFAFTFGCALGLLEEVPACGSTIVPVALPNQSTEVGAPPFMDDVFIPLSDPEPSQLIEKGDPGSRYP